MDLAKWKRSSVYMAVNNITTGKDVPYKSKLTAVLHTIDQDYKIMKVLSEDIVRDYAMNMMDDVMIKVQVPFGDYIYLIYPNKDHLEMTVTKKYLNSIGDGEDSSYPIEEIRYKCVFDPSNPGFTANEHGVFSQSSLNTAGLREIKFRLVDRNAEPLRVKMVQGIFRGVTPKELITATLLGEAQKVQVDGSPIVTGLDMVEADNKEPMGQVILSSGTHICEVPTVIQERYTGVYKYAIGTFFQRYNNNNPTWFVFPLYDFDRFDGSEDRDVMIFYFAPPKYTTNIERTYRKNAGVVEAVVTGDKIQKNTTDMTQLNDGVGYRFIDPNAFMKKPVMVDEMGAPVGARGNLNTETSFIDRRDGLYYAPVVRNIASNNYNELSKVATRQSTVLTFAWENSDESLVYPGMPVKVIYLQDDDQAELKGTILGIHATRNRQGSLGEPDRFSTKCILSIATEMNTTLPVYKTEESYDQASNVNN